MFRALVFFIQIAVLVTVSVWLANRPGLVEIDWQGWRLETSVGVLALAIFLLIVFFALLYSSWRWIRRQPNDLIKSHRYRNEAKGYRALTDGLAAVAAGDTRAARKLARRANSLLNTPSLTLLLSAQAAQLDGNEVAAKHCFEQMLDRSETEFLGLRGLILQALRDGEDERALDLSKRAYLIQPSSSWIIDTLLSLHTKSHRWLAAQKLVEEAQTKKRFSADSSRRQQAALLTERAKNSIELGNSIDAVQQAKRAHELDPSNSTAGILFARLLFQEGRERNAFRVLEGLWRKSPHPEIASTYLELLGPNSALDRYSAITKLTKENRAHPESRYVIAERAVEAHLWGEAKQQLRELETLSPTARVFRLKARLEEAETEDDTAVRRWIDRATEAEEDKSWVCSHCGTVADEWSAVCANCSAFATLSWKQPPRAYRSLIEASKKEDIVFS